MFKCLLPNKFCFNHNSKLVIETKLIWPPWALNDYKTKTGTYIKLKGVPIFNIKKFTLASENLGGGHVPPPLVAYTPSAHVGNKHLHLKSCNLLLFSLLATRAGARFGGALRQNIFKITAFEKNCCKSYLNANKMKLQKKNETIININLVKFF